MTQVLSWWSSRRNSKTGRSTVQRWAEDFVAMIVDKEGSAVTKTNLLQSRKMSINASFASTFNLTSLYHRLGSLSPTMVWLVHAFSTTTRQKRESTAQSVQRKQRVSVCLFS